MATQFAGNNQMVLNLATLKIAVEDLINQNRYAMPKLRVTDIKMSKNGLSCTVTFQEVFQEPKKVSP